MTSDFPTAPAGSSSTLDGGDDVEGGGESGRALFAALFLEAGRTAGAYALRELIGQGGMGSVFRADRSDGRFEGQAAVKLLNAGQLGQGAEARFRQEGRILARLEHPNIARLLDAGVTPFGRPYLILEYVVGEHIDAYCDRRRLGVEARLRLFLQVLEAVAHAHARLIVHRDLKPSNVLVTEEGRVKLLDFGIAKLLEGDGEDVPPALTREGGGPRTPRYAAPEQILDEPLGTTTDVYALGVMLNELLSGALPYRLKGGGRRELEDAIVRDEPVRPSQGVTATAAEARGLGVGELARRLRGDLDAIVGKALAKVPSDRYLSVGAFADDLEGYLADRPVRARAEGRFGRLGRFLRRNRAAVAIALGVAVSLSTTTAVALRQAARANAEAASARQAAARADAAHTFLADIFSANSSSQDDPAKARATTARELLDLGARRIDQNLAHDPEGKLRLLDLLAEMYVDLGLDDEGVAIARRAVDVGVATYGENDARTAGALLSLSNKLHASSFSGERGPVIDRAERIIAALPAGEVALRARLEVERAESARSVSAERALAHAERAVALYRGTDDIEGLAGALRLAAQNYHSLGQQEATVVACSESIALLERATGERSSELTKLYTVLGEAEIETREFARAEEHHRKAVEHARRRQGPDHVDVLQTEMRLGVFYSRTEQYRLAHEHLDLAREVGRRVLADGESFHLPPVLGERGYARALSGDPEGGLPDLARSVELRRSARKGTLFLAQLLGDEAFALIELGRYEEGRARIDEADTILSEAKAPAGARVSTVLWRARLLVAEGAFDEADRLLADIDAQLQARYTRQPLIAPVAWLARGEVALARGDLDGAVRQALRVRESLPGDERYYGIRRSRVALLEGGVALARGRPAEALPLFQQALDRRLGELHPDALPIAEVHVALARAQLALGHRDAARAIYQRAARAHEKHAAVPSLYSRPLEALHAALGAD